MATTAAIAPALPPGTTLRSENGVIHIEMVPVVWRWVHWTALGMLLSLSILVILIAWLVTAHRATGSLWLWNWLAAEIIAGAIAIILGFGVLLYLCLLFLRVRARFNGQHLFLDDGGSTYAIPLAAVKRIDVAMRWPLKLAIDPAAKPANFFSYRHGFALEIVTPEGRLQFFRAWGCRELFWLAHSLSATLPITSIPAQDNDVAVDASRLLYGSSRRVVLMMGLTAAVAIIAGSLWIGNWLGVAAGAFLLLVTSPLHFQKLTPEQDALALEYRVANMPVVRTEETNLLRWEQPHAVAEHELRRSLARTLTASVCFLAALALSLLGLQELLGPIMPPMEWDRFVPVACVLVAPVILLVTAHLLPRRAKPLAYRITAKGLRIGGPSSPHVLPWTQLVSFTVEPHRILAWLDELVMHHRSGESRRIALPEDATLTANILAHVAARIPQTPPPPAAQAFTNGEWLIALLLTTAMAAFLGPWIIEHRSAPHLRHWLPWVPFVLLLFSPANLFAFAMRRRRAGTQLFIFAFAFNMLAFVVTTLSAAIADLRFALSSLH